MRYLSVSVRQDPAVRHPMHQFVVETPGYEASRLVHVGWPSGDEHALLFHVDGDPDPDQYAAALADVDRLLEWELSTCPDGTFYLYVRERLRDSDAQFVDAFDRPGLVVVTPVEYRSDGSVRLTVVGPAPMLQDALDDTPDGMTVEVLAVGEYDARRLDVGGGLTDRQFEAVVAAVDCGYYGATREGSVADVAARLDCATGTAAEILRRAERTVMEAVAGHADR